MFGMLRQIFGLPNELDALEAINNSLLQAVVQNNIDELAALLAAGANPDTADQNGQTPVWMKAYWGNTECLQLLIEAGADVNTADRSGQTPVWIAAYRGNPECLQMLIVAGADVNTPPPGGQTPVWGATYEGNTECLRILISHGADVTTPANDDTTPLMIATQRGHQECADMIFGKIQQDEHDVLNPSSSLSSRGSVDSIDFGDIKIPGRKCVQASQLNDDQYRLKEFLKRFSECYSYFCPKSAESIKPDSSLHDDKLQMGNTFIDIRPKKHKLSEEFKDVVKNARKEKSFYFNIGNLHTDSIIYSLFTGISTNLPKNYRINFVYANEKFDALEYGNSHIPQIIKFYGQRMVYNIHGVINGSSKNSQHAMLFVQEADGQIYLFNPNGFANRWTKLILRYKDRFLDLFENKGNGDIYNLFPDFSLNVNIQWDDYYSQSRKMKLSVNAYGLCKSICYYFKMIITLNTTQSLYNLLYYLFGKLLHFKTRTFNNYFNDVILKQISDKILKFKNRPKSFGKLELSISAQTPFDYMNNIRNMGNVEDLWTEATLGFYLFLLESYAVIILKSIEWCNYYNYNDYPFFLKSLKGNEEIFRFDKFKQDKCTRNKICLYKNFLKTGDIYGILKILKISKLIKLVYPPSLYYAHLIKDLLPNSFNKLIKAGYNPSDDTPLKNKTHVTIYYNNLVVKLLGFSPEEALDIRKEAGIWNPEEAEIWNPTVLDD
jgi:hypothetical protein